MDISDNIVHMDAAIEIATLIKINSNLKSLNLNDCNLLSKMNDVILDALDSLQDQIKIQKIGYKYNELYEE